MSKTKIDFNNDLWWLTTDAGIIGTYHSEEEAQEAEIVYLAERDSYETQIWNKAIIAALEAILISRSGGPGPYWHDVIRLLKYKTYEEEDEIEKQLLGYKT